MAVGKTKGRGRQDREHQNAKTVKAIYVYPLQADFRARMGVPEPVGIVALQPGEGLDGDDWASQEFGGAVLGDERLSERLVGSARMQAAQPGQAFSAVAKGDWPATKGYYRFIDQPDDSPTNVASILAPHRARTVQRMKAHATVLCIQDGTDLNFSGLAQCEGLGSIGTNQTGASSAGLHLHSTFVVTTEGLPLGLLDAQCHAPVPRAEDDKRASADIPIEEKKTFNWIEALRDCVALAPQIPDTQMVCVMDREADFFELFDEQRNKPRVELLVRAKHNRKTHGDDLRLFEAVRQSPLQSQFLLPVKRQSARPKRSRQKARDQVKPRTAQVQLRYLPMTIDPPARLGDKLPVKLWVVHVREASPPADTKPVEWFPADDLQARRCRGCPGVRALVLPALAHRRLASRPQKRLRHRGAGSQDPYPARARHRHPAGDRLAHHADDAVGQNLSDAPRRGAVLGHRDRSACGLRQKKQLAAPKHLGAAVRLVARLGGYIGRRTDLAPGHEVIWRGHAQLMTLCEGFVLGRDSLGLANCG